MANNHLHRNLGDVLLGRGSVARYGVIGVTGVALDFIIFALLVRVGIFPVVATAIGTLVGIVNNYAWNSYFNFRFALSRKRGARFLIVGLVGLASSAGLLQLLVTAGLDPLVAKWISFPIVVGCQFLANKFWTFKMS